MEVALIFDFAGIGFKVNADVNYEGELESIFSVEAWDDKNRKYIKIPCKLEQFEKDMEDQINQALEEYNLAKKLFAADLAYDSARDEGRL